VVYDTALFRILIRCLSSSPNTRILDSSVTTESSSLATLGRKRSLSLSVDSKSLKAGVSPVPAARGGSDAASMQMRPKGLPSFHVPTWAATVLFSAWEYFDHWPAPLLQVYADDCFGPRLWVDHEHCQLFTANLALAHTVMDEEEQLSEDFFRDQAASVADTFRSFFSSSEDSVAEEVGASASKKTSLFTNRSSTSFASSSESRKPLWHRRIRSGRSESFSESEDSLPSSTYTASNTLAGDDISLNKEESSYVDPFQKRSDVETESPISELVAFDVPSAVGRPADEVLNASILQSLHPPSSFMGLADRFVYPLNQKILQSRRIRQRFFHNNLLAAHDIIFASLSHRLDIKSKQNLNLLQCLPSFICIPNVRALVASNLEKWFQSPALAAPARSLLSTTVAHMRMVDPPLQEDLKVVDSIVGMKLKTNQVCVHLPSLLFLILFVTSFALTFSQLQSHIDCVKAIAKRLPFPFVINHMYSTFLNEIMLVSMAPANSDSLRMIGVIHRVTLPTTSYEAIAAAMLMLLVRSGTPSTTLLRYPQRDHLVRKLRSCIRALASSLGSSFDSRMLLDALVSFQVSSDSWSFADEEDKARLMIQCVTLAMAPFVNNASSSENDVLAVRSTLYTLRKQLLTWCCTEYGPFFRSKTPLKRLDYFRNGIAVLKDSGLRNQLPHWLKVVRCVLFLEAPESPYMKNFMIPSEEEIHEDSLDWEQEILRLKVCFNSGGDIKDDLVWIVVKSAAISNNIDAEMAIYIMEHLFEKSGQLRNALFTVNDPNIVWDLYNLVQYTPEARLWNSGADSWDRTVDDLVKDHPR
jgi:Protein of unknown function (DUF3677)